MTTIDTMATGAPLAEDILAFEAMTVTTNLTLPTTSEAAIKALDNLTYVLVPFGWSRVTTDKKAVYYVTPSGRVLFNGEEASRYINSIGHCQCYLNTELAFTEVFCFDAAVGTLQLPKPVAPQQCVDWMQLLTPADAVVQIRTTRGYLKNHEAADPVKARRAAGLPIPHELDWKELLITNSGDIFYRGLTTDHLKHLAFEFAQTGVDMSSMVVIDAQDTVSEKSDEPEKVPVEGFIVNDRPHLVFVSTPANGSDCRAIQLNHDGTVSPIDIVYQVVKEVEIASEVAEKDEDESDVELDEEEIHTTIDNVQSSDSEATILCSGSETEIDNDWQPQKQVPANPCGTATCRPKRQSAAVAIEKMRIHHQQLRLMRALESQEDETLAEKLIVKKARGRSKKVIDIKAVDVTKSISTDSDDAPRQKQQNTSWKRSLTPKGQIEAKGEKARTYYYRKKAHAAKEVVKIPKEPTVKPVESHSQSVSDQSMESFIKERLRSRTQSPSRVAILSTRPVALNPGSVKSVSGCKPLKNSIKFRSGAQPCRVAIPSIRPIAMNPNRVQPAKGQFNFQIQPPLHTELIDLETDDEYPPVPTPRTTDASSPAVPTCTIEQEPIRLSNDELTSDVNNCNVV